MAFEEFKVAIKKEWTERGVAWAATSFVLRLIRPVYNFFNR